MCERLQKEDAARAVLNKYESLPRTKLIREVQREIVKRRYTKPLAIGLEWIDARIDAIPHRVRAKGPGVAPPASFKRSKPMNSGAVD
jgi:hypothetical protein